jgi:hypothetical protein
VKEQEPKPPRATNFAPETLPVRVVLWVVFITFSLGLIGLVARGVIIGLMAEKATQEPRSFPAHR